MPYLPIESHGVIGDMHTAALVGLDGSIDWLCLPRFDSDACFAALLGTEENGRWLIAPAGEVLHSTRRYRLGTPILETTFETAEGAVTLIDFMPLAEDEEHVDLLRIVRGDFDATGMLPTEPRLAEELGVSRNVLREAVKVLISKGLVDVRPKSGMRVRPQRDWTLLDHQVLTWFDLAGQRLHHSFDLVEFRLRAADGSWRSFRSLNTPFLRDEVGRVRQILGVSEDVTAQKRAEEALRRAEKLESLAVLAGGLAHDFGNLLTPVLGRAELLLARLEPESPLRTHAEAIRTAPGLGRGHGPVNHVHTVGPFGL